MRLYFIRVLLLENLSICLRLEHSTAWIWLIINHIVLIIITLIIGLIIIIIIIIRSLVGYNLQHHLET